MSNKISYKKFNYIYLSVVVIAICITTVQSSDGCANTGVCTDCFDWCANQPNLCTIEAVRNLCKRTCRQCDLQFDELSFWSSWTPVTSCSKSCGSGGMRKMGRKCRVSGGAESNSCEGDSEKMEPCDAPPCMEFTDWEWTPCSVPCGGGTKNGTRTCLGESRCLGMIFTIVACNDQPCDETKWVADGDWSECSNSCGRGLQVLNQRCQNGNPGDEGCPVTKWKKVKPCNVFPCPPPVVWSDWTEFSPCQVTCGSDANIEEKLL